MYVVSFVLAAMWHPRSDCTPSLHPLWGSDKNSSHTPTAIKAKTQIIIIVCFSRHYNFCYVYVNDECMYPDQGLQCTDSTAMAKSNIMKLYPGMFNY